MSLCHNYWTSKEAEKVNSKCPSVKWLIISRYSGVKQIHRMWGSTRQALSPSTSSLLFFSNIWVENYRSYLGKGRWQRLEIYDLSPGQEQDIRKKFILIKYNSVNLAVFVFWCDLPWKAGISWHLKMCSDDIMVGHILS